ncbi:MAG: lipase maturation factor family protein [Proteobacteria bacterium]|nr:lipase maturation factor family protein [Pseudomonadota bacterium]
MEWFRRNYLSIDPRTLGFARIALALLLLADLGQRIGSVELWYSNSGLLPNHTGLWQPTRHRNFSLFWTCSHWPEALVLMLLIGIVYLGLLVGYRTRWCQVLTLLALVSLQSRVDLLTAGEGYALSNLVCWTVFLPLGRRFSVDAVLADLRLRSDLDDEHLAGARQPARDVGPVVSLAVLAVLVQLAVLYFFNAVTKDGPTWMEGTAVYYFWQQERILTVLGLWAREHAPLELSYVLTYGTLLAEAALPWLILVPFGRPWTRRIAIALICGLHISIALLSNLGVFSYVMMVYATLLVGSKDWQAVERWARSRPRLQVLYDGSNRMCFQFSRLVDRLGLSGYAAQAIASAGPARQGSRDDAAPLRQRVRRYVTVARETLVALLVIVATMQLCLEVRVIPRVFKPDPMPEWAQAVVGYTRMQQGWQLFAPDAPLSEAFVLVDAVTSTGRHVDPLAEAGGYTPTPQARAIPVRPGLDTFWIEYHLRIPVFWPYHQPLKDWIARYHERTGRTEDRIVRWEAFLLEHDSPRPGELRPTRQRYRKFLEDSLEE